MLHSEFPKTCRHLTGGKPPAPIEGMSAPALADVLSYLESQKSVHHQVWLSLGASPTHVAAAMAITGKDSTGARSLIRDGMDAKAPAPMKRAQQAAEEATEQGLVWLDLVCSPRRFGHFLPLLELLAPVS